MRYCGGCFATLHGFKKKTKDGYYFRVSHTISIWQLAWSPMISQFFICAWLMAHLDSRWPLRALLQWRSASLCHMLGLWVEWASRKESLWLLVVAFMAKVSRLVGIGLRLPEDFSLLQRRFLFMFQSVHFWCLGSTRTSTCTGSIYVIYMLQYMWGVE